MATPEIKPGSMPRKSSWKLEKPGANVRRFITGNYDNTTFEENSEKEKNGLIKQNKQILQVTKPNGFMGSEEKYTFKVLDNGIEIPPEQLTNDEKAKGFDNSIKIKAFNDWQAYRNKLIEELKVDSASEPETIKGGKNKNTKRRKSKKSKKSKRRTIKK
jgi:hypothetical protein